MTDFLQSFCNEKFRPYVDIRILHTIILDDPFDDPKGLVVPDHSPERTVPEEEVVPRGLTKDDLKDKNQGKSLEELEKEKKRLEAQSNAVILEMLGDLPDADVKPPENVLFVCQLNPITEDEDLKMIFFRFGVKSCEVLYCIHITIQIIRDHTTGNSLGYAFIEFETEQGAVDAYYKMNNVLIDDRRIKVDFSQSVAKLWNRRRRGEVMTTYNGSTDRSRLELAENYPQVRHIEEKNAIVLIESVLEAGQDIPIIEVILGVIHIVVIDIDCVCLHSHVTKVDESVHSNIQSDFVCIANEILLSVGSKSTLGEFW